MLIHKFVPGSTGITVLLLHGTGGDENDLLPIGRSLAPGAALLSPRGQVLENGAPRFFRRLRPGVFDEVDLRARTAELSAFVSECATKYSFDPARVYALGYSNGANIAAALMLLDPAVLAGAVLLRATVPLTPEILPDLNGKPVLILAGQEDSMTPAALTQQLARMLSESGALVEVQWQDGGHELTPQDFQAAKAFLSAQCNH